MSRLLAVIACMACSTPGVGASPSSSTSGASAEPRKPDRYTAHIDALKKRLSAKGLGNLKIQIEEPFVVVGNGTAAQLASDARTVRWAADILQADFFSKQPSEVLTVFLFRDADSYEKGVRRLTGDEPGTPYGFYSKTHGGLFMNIATGGGTLVHEIVHPYVEADFPNAPPWLNEGLGSLFEQSAERNGHIVGLTNWRLAGLQKAIKTGSVPSFRALTHLGDNEFYGDDSGVNYAASRYLLYYLQEKSLLHDFYTKFRTGREQDPSGYATLTAVLGEKDMDAFQKRWSVYVAKLAFP